MCAVVRAIRPAVRPAVKTPLEIKCGMMLYMIVSSFFVCMLAYFLVGGCVSAAKYMNSIDPSMMDDDDVTFSFHIQSNIVNMTIRLENRPLDEDKFDRNMWKFLHTIAATYPNNPSNEVKSVIQQFIWLLARVYPCEMCATVFTQIVLYHPPDTRSQKSFSKWMCEAHNMVNEKLEKPLFDCSKINKLWRANCSDGTFRLLVTYDINLF